MKKYELVYDLDRKIIGLYKEGNESPSEKSKVNVVFIILLVILILAVAGLSYFIFFYLKKTRKSRAFELNDDNFDYVPSN